MKPMLLINFKTYKTGVGQSGLKLACIAEKISMKHDVKICLAVDAPSLHMISKAVKIPVFAQHIDSIEYGPYTGHILAESVKECGACGTLINHAEKQLSRDMIEAAVKKCKSTGLEPIVCVSSLHDAKEIAMHKPDYISYEDPVFIGTGNSITKTQPDALIAFIEEIKKIDRSISPICGAGVSFAADIEKALHMGMSGVIVASAIMNSPNPEEKINELALALKNAG